MYTGNDSMNTNRQVSAMLRNASPDMLGIDDCIDFLISMSPIDKDPTFFSGTERDEYKAWLTDVKKMHLKTVLEIGTYRGRTTWLLSRVCPPDVTIVTVELVPGAPWADIEQMGLPGQRIISLIGDSRDESTRQIVEKALGGQRVDLLFIDSSHEYAQTKREIELYFEFMKPDGKVAFHDILLPHLGVHEVWQELTKRYPLHREYTQGYGIGVITVGESP
jgi:hypothetical protein